MLLESLLMFEEAVESGSGRGAGAAASSVTWSNPAECEAYVGRLQKAAERLSAENRKLRKAHAKMGEQVRSLLRAAHFALIVGPSQ